MSQCEYRILTGTAGWQHPGWGNEVFYPDDLPKDWYLSFYSNEFPVVLVPGAQWCEVSGFKLLVEEIAEQAVEGFKCVFEWDWSAQTNLSVDERIKGLKSIQAHISGLLILIDIAAIDDNDFCDAIIKLNRQLNVCLEIKNDAADLDRSKLASFCQQHAISVCYKGSAEVIVPGDSKLWVVRCDSQQDNKALMLHLKLLVGEQLKHESLTREHVLIIDGQPPDVEVLRKANIIIDIM